MKGPSKKTVLGLILIILFGLTIYGEYSFSLKVIESKKKLDTLKRNQLTLERSVEEKTKQVAVFKKAIAELEKYQLGIPEDEVDFYDKVQQEMTDNTVRSNRITAAKAGGGRSAVAIDFEGAYYDILQTLADWRGMDVVVRVSGLNLSSGTDGLSKGNITIESVLRGGE